MTHTQNSQSGSMIIFIFIFIGIFAALSYAVSQSMRVDGTGSGKASKENMGLQYVEVTNFFEAVKTRFVEMTAVNGTPVLNLSFKNDVYQNVNGSSMCTNENSACTNSSCYMYSPYAPSGVRPVIFSTLVADTEPTLPTYQKNGHVLVIQLAVEGVGSSKSDLAMRIFGVSPAFCNYYNSKQGVTTAYDDATTLSSIGETTASSQGNVWGACAGPASWNTSPDVFGEEATIFKGKTTFCAPARVNAATSRLAVTYVLQAR